MELLELQQFFQLRNAGSSILLLSTTVIPDRKRGLALATPLFL
jgi:hypothetical protein